MTDPNDPAEWLTKRECYAALAMAGFAASAHLNDGVESAKCAVVWADALIAELNK